MRTCQRNIQGPMEENCMLAHRIDNSQFASCSKTKRLTMRELSVELKQKDSDYHTRKKECRVNKEAGMNGLVRPNPRKTHSRSAIR